MDDLTVKNLRVTQETRITPDGETVHFVSATFMLGTHGPFTITRQSTQFSAQVINQAIDVLRQSIVGIQ